MVYLISRLLLRPGACGIYDLRMHCDYHVSFCHFVLASALVCDLEGYQIEAKKNR